VLKCAKQLFLELIRETNWRHRARLRIFPKGMMLIARAAASGVVALNVLAYSDGSFGDKVCVLSMSCGGSYIGDVASASTTGAECAIAMAAHHSRSHDLAVHVFGIVGVDISRSAAAMGYFSSHGGSA